MASYLEGFCENLSILHDQTREFKFELTIFDCQKSRLSDCKIYIWEIDDFEFASFLKFKIACDKPDEECFWCFGIDEQLHYINAINYWKCKLFITIFLSFLFATNLQVKNMGESKFWKNSKLKKCLKSRFLLKIFWIRNHRKW